MSDFQCSFCGHSKSTFKKTRYIYRRGEDFLIVNNVPCEECEFCGEHYFETKVLEKIEKDFQDIKSGAKKTQTLNVPVEQFAS